MYKEHFWTNSGTGLTTIFWGNEDGDFRVSQEKGSFNSSRRLFAHYDYRPAALIHAVLFCMETKQAVPHREDWKSMLELEETEKAMPASLISIIRAAREGVPIRMSRMPFSKESVAMPGKPVPIIESFSRKPVYPIITEDNGLAYIAETGVQIINWANEDIPQVFEGIILPMARNTRGQKSKLASVYSKFPFAAY
jgi:hypothetical protein